MLLQNWLNAGSHQSSRPNVLRMHEIARNIIYHLDQLAEEDYWEVVSKCKNAYNEWSQAIGRYRGTNPALTNLLYEKHADLADKKREAFVYQVEIEKILLQGGFAHKKEEKDHIYYHIKMLADGFDPDDIPASAEEADSTNWQSDYWGDEDPDYSGDESDDTDLSEV
jgi:hypothetical protein